MRQGSESLCSVRCIYRDGSNQPSNLPTSQHPFQPQHKPNGNKLPHLHAHPHPVSIHPPKINCVIPSTRYLYNYTQHFPRRTIPVISPRKPDCPNSTSTKILTQTQCNMTRLFFPSPESGAARPTTAARAAWCNVHVSCCRVVYTRIPTDICAGHKIPAEVTTVISCDARMAFFSWSMKCQISERCE
jgi:hypothetical protein